MANGPRKRSVLWSSFSISVSDFETFVNQTKVIKKPKANPRFVISENNTPLEDIKPIVVDSGIGFHNVGGLQEHTHCLREMVVFLMIYRNAFEMFEQHTAKGVIFHGPPGIGKTLHARALVNECSKGRQKVSFFVHSSDDVLYKWVGESERQHRLFLTKQKKWNLLLYSLMNLMVRLGKMYIRNGRVT